MSDPSSVETYTSIDCGDFVHVLGPAFSPSPDLGFVKCLLLPFVSPLSPPSTTEAISPSSPYHFCWGSGVQRVWGRWRITIFRDTYGLLPLGHRGLHLCFFFYCPKLKLCLTVMGFWVCMLSICARVLVLQHFFSFFFLIQKKQPWQVGPLSLSGFTCSALISPLIFISPSFTPSPVLILSCPQPLADRHAQVESCHWSPSLESDEPLSIFKFWFSFCP